MQLVFVSAANRICYPTEGENSSTEQYGVGSEIVCKHVGVMEIGRTSKMNLDLEGWNGITNWKGNSFLKNTHL